MEAKDGSRASGVGSREPHEASGRPDSEPGSPDSMALLWAQAAHDLRQPVQTAQLLASLLDATGGRAELERAACGIAAALQSLHEMLEALTLIARSEAGLLPVERRPCRLADILEPALRALEEPVAGRGSRLRLRTLQGEVLSHPGLLALAGRSLVLNAVRLGDRGDILVGCRRARDALTLEVRFGGPPPGDGAGAHAFVQLPPAGDRMSAGELGLGLALLRRLCRPLGHELRQTVSESGWRRLALTMPLAGRQGAGSPQGDE